MASEVFQHYARGTRNVLLSSAGLPLVLSLHHCWESQFRKKLTSLWNNYLWLSLWFVHQQ